MISPTLHTAIMNRINSIPIVDTLKMQIITLADGYCEARVPRGLQYNGVFESFHGGLLMTVADSAACFAIFTLTGPAARLTTTDMNIRFLAPCLTDVIAKAKVIKAGRTLCPVAIELFDTEDRQVAVAQVSYILLNGRP